MNIKYFFRRIVSSSHQTEDTPEKEKEQEIQVIETESIQFIDLGLLSGTLWADRNAGAEDKHKLGVLYDRAHAPGQLPTYEQCES